MFRDVGLLATMHARAAWFAKWTVKNPMSGWMTCRCACSVVCTVSSAVGHADNMLPAHRIVAHAMVDALPPDIAPLFHERLEAFEAFVVEPAADWPRDPALKRRNHWHDVQVDVDASVPTEEARSAACRAFPRDEASAQRLYRAHGVTYGGTLPWAIDNCYDELTRAFRSGGQEDVLAWAGYLTHFAADAANPLRLSTLGKQPTDENPRFGGGRGPHPQSAFFTLRERYGVGMVDRHAGVYAASVHLTAADSAPITDARNAAFDLIERSLAFVGRIADADQAALDAVRSSDSPDPDQEAYYRTLHAACGPVCVDRLRDASVFAANLVGGAWHRAGAPALVEIRGRRMVPEEDRRNDVQPPAVFVGSRHSQVYHKADCPFAQRISVENRVTFASAKDAAGAGRRPCKHCKPQ